MAASAPSVTERLQAAVGMHQAGNLAGAGRLYELVLAVQPGNVDALYLSGLAIGQSGNLPFALTRLKACLDQRPGHVDARLAVANALRSLGRHDESTDSYRAVLKLRPLDQTARNSLAATLIDRQRTDSAVQVLHALLAIDPAHIDGWNNLAIASLESGAENDAVDAYRRSLTLERGNDKTWAGIASASCDIGRPQNALPAIKRALALHPQGVDHLYLTGHVLDQHGQPDKAVEAWRRVLFVEPEHERAITQIAIAAAERGDFNLASEIILRPLQRRRGVDGAKTNDDSFHTTGRTKLRHTAEQLDHLVVEGRLDESFAAIAKEARLLAEQIEPNRRAELRKIKPPPSTAFLRAFNRLHYVAPAASIPGGVLNPDQDWARLQHAFADDGPCAVQIDNLLREPAWIALRRYCMESTVWFQNRFAEEVGGRLAEGLCCPLIFQLAHELKTAMPGLLSGLRLRTVFGYIYFQVDQDGHLHADQGIVGDRRVVSLNYWLTPTNANADPDHGGLWVWNKRAPEAYFRTSDEALKVRILDDLISAPDADARYVPYAGNRAMLFRADVLHKSEQMRFKEGLENRRISLTFVFGTRR
ncbi:MAG: tetratricopeptide repeat protein [Proteobacteria bacterium]|nr:tetratricopeptide repeat protein [Pseudomonadota bacterium]